MSLEKRDTTPSRSVNADWARALQRTAPIRPDSTRTLAIELDDMAARQPDRAALVGEGVCLSYGELSALTNQYSRWAIAEGLRAGDRVGLMMANCPDYVAIWIGLTRVGVVVALLNTQIVGDGLRHCIAIADLRAVIADAALLSALRATGVADAVKIWSHGATIPGSDRVDWATSAFDSAQLNQVERRDVRLRDPALLIYTSGTTGLPKAARVSHFRVAMWSHWFAGAMDARDDDRLYNCLPMYHSVGGVVAIGAMLVAGGAVIIRGSFSVRRFWPDVVESQATIFQYIGELCRYLLGAPERDAAQGHRLRLCCGNGLREEVWREFQNAFAIPRILEFYASTEGSFSLFNFDERPGSIGRIPRFMAHLSPVALIRVDAETGQPMRGGDGFALRCAANEAGEAIGRVEANTDALATRFEGYTSLAESNGKILRDVFKPGDCWFRTGDLMEVDEQGFYYFVDRLGETFRWKGENVSATEVAVVLASCRGVQDVAVYGARVPGAEGRAGMAAIVPDPDFSLATLRAQIHARLPRYARPLFIRILHRMSLTGTYKLKKSELMRDGFDPSIISDPLYFDDAALGEFRLLDAALCDDIASGRLAV